MTDCLPHRLAIHTPRLINDIPSGGMSSGLYLSLAPFLPARGKVKWKTEGGGGGRDTSRDRLFERSTFLDLSDFSSIKFSNIKNVSTNQPTNVSQIFWKKMESARRKERMFGRRYLKLSRANESHILRHFVTVQTIQIRIISSFPFDSSIFENPLESF